MKGNYYKVETGGGLVIISIKLQTLAMPGIPFGRLTQCILLESGRPIVELSLNIAYA